MASFGAIGALSFGEGDFVLVVHQLRLADWVASGSDRPRMIVGLVQ